MTGDEHHSSDPTASDRRRLAIEAERLLDRDADAAEALAREVIDGGQPIADGAAASAHRVLAVAALRRGDAGSAAAHIDLAISSADRSGVPVALGKALMTAMAVAASTGEPERALELADRAAPLLPRDLRVRLEIQRGSVLVAGFSDLDQAIAVFDRVLVQFPDLAGFELGILRLNRGTQLLRRGDLRAASDDFEQAAVEFRRVENRGFETASMLHLAVAAARMGDLPTVFEIHRRLTEDDALSRSDPHDHLDLAECLVISGLLSEADELINRAIDLSRGSGVTEFSVQVQLLATRIQRLLGGSRAEQAADRAYASAEDLGSEVMIAIASIERAALRPTERFSASAIAELWQSATVLAAAGHRREALDAEIEALQRLSVADDSAVGEGLPLVDSDLTPFDRAQLRHLRALRLFAAGNSARARRELVIGIRDIEGARASIVAADVRAAAGDRAPRMAELGLRWAIESGRPRPVLEWAERVRATALRLASSARAEGVNDQLDELRRLDASDSAGTGALERRITSRVRAGRSAGAVVRASNAGEICAGLGPERVLLEYLEVEGRLWLCVVRRQRVSLIDLGVGVDEIEGWVGKLLFGLRRMATRAAPTAHAAASMVEQVASQLARLVLPPQDRLDEAEVVIVPTGPLHHLPWAVLPPLTAVPFVVVPSAHVWCTVSNHSGRGDGVVVATGPGLVAADAEAHEIGAIWPQPLLRVHRATSADLRSSLPGSRIAHLCCHGRFRTDSPQFSALELADGPFTVFDLEGIAEMPRLVVLSACSLGSVDVRLGDDLLGFPAALFARGVSTLIASVLPVEDTATRAMMVRLHEALAAGSSPSRATRDARTAVRENGPGHAAAAASFLCFGAG